MGKLVVFLDLGNEAGYLVWFVLCVCVCVAAFTNVKLTPIRVLRIVKAATAASHPGINIKWEPLPPSPFPHFKTQKKGGTLKKPTFLCS